MTAPTLRPYQLEAVEAIRARFRAGDRSTLLVLATGLGKTVIASEAIRRTVERGKRCLFVAHRTELLEQTQRKLRDVGVWAELEQGRRTAGDAPVVVASVQTIRGKRLERFARDAFGLVVIDEAHHAAAAGYVAIRESFDAYFLGLTATPDRLDGQPLGNSFASVAYRYELREGIRDGYLAPIRAKRISLASVDLSEIRTRAGDLAQDELAEVMRAEQALHQVAIPLLRESGDRRTIAFCVDVAHARALAEVLNRYQPGVARSLDGSADEIVRRVTLGEFEAGDFRILCNVALFTEGFDSPATSCIAMCRPTKSRGLFTQVVGRGTRLAPGKVDCLVLDFVGNVGRHRLACPADVLAGRALEDDARTAYDRALDAGASQEELDEILAHAEAEAARKREEAKVTAVARYLAEDVDPFLGELPALDPRTDATWAQSPMTERQRATLVHLGHSKLPEEMTAGEAQRLLDAHARRRESGMATFKQVRVLKRQGYENAETMTFYEATRAMVAVRESGFKPYVRRAKEQAEAAKEETDAA